MHHHPKMAHNRFKMIWVDFHLKLELIDVSHQPILQMVLVLQMKFDCILVSMIAIAKIINCTLDKII